MRGKLFLVAIVGVLFSTSIFCYAQEKVLVLREAKERQKTTAAVEVYLIGDILEVTVTARMYAEKPRIFSLLLVGPKLGRLSATERETLFADSTRGEDIFLTEEIGGFIRFDEKKKEKKLKGTLTRELHKLKIPIDKVVPGKHYQLWVKVDSLQRGGKPQNFKFDLPNFPQLFSP